ncbi:MAG: NAD(P)/FAD-dependent oxidoreductase, partial [Bacteroidia bacterium]
KRLLIVGSGLSGICVAHTAIQYDFDITITSNPNLSNCSKIAAGIWNPIVFKRLTKSWNIDDALPKLNSFYASIETLLGISIAKERKIIKPLNTEEQKLWNKKQNELNNYISPVKNNDGINYTDYQINKHYGEVLNSGNINLPILLEASLNYFKREFTFQEENFDYRELTVFDTLSYKNYSYDYVIFCEGYLVKNNPWFNYIPLKPVKGEVLEIESENLKPLNDIVNHNGFILALENNKFKVGATYNWDDLTENPTEEGKSTLEKIINRLIDKPYSITKHAAGVRPSSIDRRPVIGPHPKHKNLFVFNGMGTKGVMLAPLMAEHLFNYICKAETIPEEVNVARFNDKLI